MANLSDLTRKEQILAYLKDHLNDWVDGTELATEQIGGSEGLRRLRDLRSDGHFIQQRRHPDPNRDIWQYRLIEKAEVSPIRVAANQGTKLVFGVNKICSYCDGKGKRHGQQCEGCEGKGWT